MIHPVFKVFLLPFIMFLCLTLSGKRYMVFAYYFWILYIICSMILEYVQLAYMLCMIDFHK